MGRIYSWDGGVVFQWNISPKGRLDHVRLEKAFFKETWSYVRKKEKGCKTHLINLCELRSVVGIVLDIPEGGRGYLWGRYPVAKRRKYTASVLGYAWIGIGDDRFLSLYYSRIPTPDQHDRVVRMVWASLDLEEHLRRKGLAVPKEAERVNRVGNVLLGGLSFRGGPDWLAPVEDPQIKVHLVPTSSTWDAKRPTWEDLHVDLPERLAQSITGLLQNRGIDMSPLLLAKALKGEVSGLEALGLSLLGGY